MITVTVTIITQDINGDYMKRSLQNIVYGMGSILKLYDHNVVPSLSDHIALGGLKDDEGGVLKDSLNVHKDIAVAWEKRKAL